MEKSYLNLFFLNDGFFGTGDTIEFENFSLAHLLPLVLTILTILLIKKYANKLRQVNDFNFRVYYAIFTILVGMAYYWRLIYAGPTNDTNCTTFISDLPFQICEITLLIASVALINKSEKLFNISFFLVNSTSLFPLIIPATVLYNCGPLRFRYYQYFLMHILPIISTYYLLFVHNMKVKASGIAYSAIMLSLLYAFDYHLNTILLANDLEPNYMYMNIALSLNLPSFFKTAIGLYLLYLTIFLALVGIVYFIYKKITCHK